VVRYLKKYPIELLAAIFFSIVCFAPIEPGLLYKPFPVFPDYQFWLPTSIFLLACLYEYKPSWQSWRIWRVFNSNLWITLGLLGLGLVCISWVMNDAFHIAVPRVGSFTTTGVLILLMVLIIKVLKGKLSGPRIWFLATLATSALAGFWEIIYQVCSWFSWYHTWFPAPTLVYNEILCWRPHILMVFPFLALLVLYSFKNYKLNWTTLPLIVLFITMWVLWYTVGHFWLAWYCDHYQCPPVWVYNKPINWLWYLGARSTKVVLALLQVSLVSGLGYKQIPLKPRHYAWMVVLGISIVMYLLIRPI